MNLKEGTFSHLRRQQKTNSFGDLSPANRWDSEQSNPIEDVKSAIAILSNHKTMFQRAIEYLYKNHERN